MPGETLTTLRDKLGSSAGTSAWTAGGGSSTQNHGTGQSGSHSGSIGQTIHNIQNQSAQEASQSLHAQQMKEMADTMKQAGQIGGGLSGGTYTKGPVAYPKHWYTPEGWAEVQKRGWSSKLYPEFQHKGKYSILGNEEYTEAEMDKYGRLQTLPEGVIYSSNIGNPESGYGGYKKTSLFNYGGGGGGGGGYGGYYGSGGGGGGGGSGYGFSEEQDPMQQGYQRGQTGPGTLQEQVNQIYLGMSNLNSAPGFQKSRGGIVSLLGL